MLSRLTGYSVARCECIADWMLRGLILIFSLFSCTFLFFLLLSLLVAYVNGIIGRDHWEWNRRAPWLWAHRWSTCDPVTITAEFSSFVTLSFTSPQYWQRESWKFYQIWLRIETVVRHGLVDKKEILLLRWFLLFFLLLLLGVFGFLIVVASTVLQFLFRSERATRKTFFLLRNIIKSLGIDYYEL